jgi:hypothetical protein
MPRPKPEDISSAGQDSFLDVVTNIVGILIILVMVVGGRVQKIVLTATPQARAKAAELERELEELDQSAALIESEVADLAEQARTVATAAAFAGESRITLATPVAAARASRAFRSRLRPSSPVRSKSPPFMTRATSRSKRTMD